MRKQVLFIALSIVAVGISAFTSSEKKSTLGVNVEESKVVWFGKKVTGEHTGKISIAYGDLEFEGDKLAGGSFEIDMRSITNTDVENEESRQKLVGHLKSDDFFGVEKFPKSTFVINEVTQKTATKYVVNGDLTIKGITRSIEFPVQITLLGSKASASATITIDRSEFDVKYGSGSFFDDLGDKMIYDDFTLNVTLVADK
jgi:polyisoprenoid-binding protein YceI